MVIIDYSTVPEKKLWPYPKSNSICDSPKRTWYFANSCFLSGMKGFLQQNADHLGK